MVLHLMCCTSGGGPVCVMSLGPSNEVILCLTYARIRSLGTLDIDTRHLPTHGLTDLFSSIYDLTYIVSGSIVASVCYYSNIFFQNIHDLLGGAPTRLDPLAVAISSCVELIINIFQ
jgi:hypothetical protein